VNFRLATPIAVITTKRKSIIKKSGIQHRLLMLILF